MTAAEKKITRYGLHEYVRLLTEPPIILAMQEYAEEEAIRFAEFIKADYEMVYVNDDILWQLAGTEQNYTTAQLYSFYKSQKQQP